MSEQELADMMARAAISLESLPDHTAHYALATDVTRLVPEIRRLQGLVKQAEWNNMDAGGPICAWCLWPREADHRADCPAFSASGVLR